MDGQELRSRYLKTLFEKIDESSFPSNDMLSRVESSLTTQEELAEYGEILVKKIEGSRFPSGELLARAESVVAQLAQTSDGE